MRNRLANSFETAMNLKVVSLTAVVVAAFAAQALAHHYFAMFDARKTVTLEDTVKEFEWSVRTPSFAPWSTTRGPASRRYGRSS
jgi:Family of unknown function (DUF6152)